MSPTRDDLTRLLDETDELAAERMAELRAAKADVARLTRERDAAQRACLEAWRGARRYRDSLDPDSIPAADAKLDGIELYLRVNTKLLEGE